MRCLSKRENVISFNRVASGRVGSSVFTRSLFLSRRIIFLLLVIIFCRNVKSSDAVDINFQSCPSNSVLTRLDTRYNNSSRFSIVYPNACQCQAASAAQRSSDTGILLQHSAVPGASIRPSIRI